MPGRIEYQGIDLVKRKTVGPKLTVYTSLFAFNLYELPKDTVVLGNLPPSEVIQKVGALVKKFRKGQPVNIATHDMAILHELDLQLKDSENVEGICINGDTKTTTSGPIPEPCPPLDFALEQDDRMQLQLSRE
jgi:hypothetical protein